MADISKRLLQDLQFTAGHRGKSIELDARDVRAILVALDKDWCPDVEKETKKDAAIRSLRGGLQEKYGKKNVRISFGEDDDTESDRVYQLVHISVNAEAGWPDETIKLLVRASGFSRHFEESGSGFGGQWRDYTFVSRRGRKAA